jgi:hypothetical protein
VDSAVDACVIHVVGDLLELRVLLGDGRRRVQTIRRPWGAPQTRERCS